MAVEKVKKTLFSFYSQSDNRKLKLSELNHGINLVFLRKLDLTKVYFVLKDKSGVKFLKLSYRKNKIHKTEIFENRGYWNQDYLISSTFGFADILIFRPKQSVWQKIKKFFS